MPLVRVPSKICQTRRDNSTPKFARLTTHTSCMDTNKSVQYTTSPTIFSRCMEDMTCVPLGHVCGGGPSPLPKLDIVKNGISISGLSSGADFVVQFQVAFSEIVNGLGVFAGQPYHCAVHMFEGDKLVSTFIRCLCEQHSGLEIS